MNYKDSDHSDYAADQETSTRKTVEQQHPKNGPESNPADKDSYDEFQDGMIRIGRRVRRWWRRKVKKGWRQTKFHEKVETIFEFGGLFVLIVYTTATILMYLANKVSADAAKSAADTAAGQLEMNERPWIYGEPVVTGPFTMKYGPDAYIGISFNLANSGPSPATHVVGRAILTTGEYGTMYDTVAERDALCSDMTKLALNPSQHTAEFHVVLPQEKPLLVEGGALLGIKATDYIRQHPNFKGFSFRLVTCVAYTSTFSDSTAFYTGRIYWVHFRRPMIGSALIGESIAADKVDLEPTPDIALGVIRKKP